MRVIEATGWEDYDARLIGSTLVRGDLVTSSHPAGSVQLRIRRRLCWGRLAAVAGLIAVAMMIDETPALVLAGLTLAELARGLWRVNLFARRTIMRGTALEPVVNP